MNAIVSTTANTAAATNQADIIVGEIYTCQFGNPGDSSGYRIGNARVLQHQKRFMETFLIEQLGEDGAPTGLLGCATIGQRQVGQDLYCTSGRTIGRSFMGTTWTRESAIKSLGYIVE